jgi:hypothetical protein
MTRLRFSASAVAVAAALPLLLLAQCRRQEVPRAASAPGGSDGPRATVEPPRAVPVVADAAADADDAGGPPASLGDWLDGNIYRFRLEAIRRCTSTDPRGSIRLGILVRVTTKNIEELLVAPRDFKLESGGVILDSTPLQKAPAGCAPLLAPKSVRVGKTADGIVVFDLPPGFNPEHRAVKISYQPTRWGGARRVEAALPPEALPR